MIPCPHVKSREYFTVSLNLL
eukprot:jgi/Chrzof1/3533/UNPLg00742.t1